MFLEEIEGLNKSKLKDFDFQEWIQTLRAIYLDLTSTAEDLSSSEYGDLLIKEFRGATGSLMISSLESQVRKLLGLLQKRPSSLASEECSTMKKKKESDTSTSTIPAHTTPLTVDVDSSESSCESDDPLEGIILSPPLTKTTSKGGLDIFFKKEGTQYNWKSGKFPSSTCFLELKIYPDVKEFKKLPAETAWKAASFRAKIAVRKTSPLQKLVNQIRKAIIQETKDFPGTISTQRDDWKPK